MPTLIQIRQRADDWLATRWPTVQSRQTTYLAAHGHYFQGLRTSTIEPNHLTAAFADAQPDLLSGHPTDQVDSWMDWLNEINTPIPALFILDVYDGPLGQGYVGSVYAKYNGVLYGRSQNVGPDATRTVAWHEVILT